jgi:hypothetical protein
MMQQFAGRMSMAMALAAVAAACGNRGDEAQGPPPVITASADTTWVNYDGVELPAEVSKVDPRIIEAYVFAAKHPEVLHYMPCYCGCENPQFHHESNYDCFIDGIDDSGEVPRVSPEAMGFS